MERDPYSLFSYGVQVGAGDTQLSEKAIGANEGPVVGCKHGDIPKRVPIHEATCFNHCYEHAQIRLVSHCFKQSNCIAIVHAAGGINLISGHDQAVLIRNLQSNLKTACL